MKFLIPIIALLTLWSSPLENEGSITRSELTPQQSVFPQDSIPVIQLTSGQKQHWFGYYDKWQVDPSGRYVLVGQVDHFFRSPSPQDTLRIGLIDLENGNAWQEIGFSTAWGWQQSCMLQWIPGSTEEVIWNTHGEGTTGFVSKIYNIRTGQTRTLPKPIYTLSPDGSFALGVDFDRLQFFRPGYGYPTKVAQSQWEKAPDDQGIYKMDLQTGQSKLILSYAQIAKLPRRQGSVATYHHWFNHLLINPSGTRFIFLNRSRPVGSPEEMTQYLKDNPDYRKGRFSGQYVTRAITADLEGKNLFALNDSGQFSHFIWKGDRTICAWAIPDDGDQPGFFDFQDQTKSYKQVGAGIMTRNGHNTYVPNTNYEWILNDTYPVGMGRLQELYLYHIPTQRKVMLGKFHEPRAYKGEWRCDLHPRSSQDGRFVIFDSTHGGAGRQTYMIDISKIVGL